MSLFFCLTTEKNICTVCTHSQDFAENVPKWPSSGAKLRVPFVTLNLIKFIFMSINNKKLKEKIPFPNQAR